MADCLMSVGGTTVAYALLLLSPERPKTSLRGLLRTELRPSLSTSGRLLPTRSGRSMLRFASGKVVDRAPMPL